MDKVLEIGGGDNGLVNSMVAVDGQLYMWWVDDATRNVIDLARVDVAAGMLEPMSAIFPSEIDSLYEYSLSRFLARTCFF
ncbi:hypothetical protein FNF28_07810 [Cafeteria roenbergensis]|uniref:Uncharacterized protein n=1 Tax=Cafeteria roenbergensis TaxID=33653 RepID=A0A5A8C101_CAFRO|nr:hypothetical protein FNF28_07810 [Cafeteria roenbergensis]